MRYPGCLNMFLCWSLASGLQTVVILGVGIWFCLCWVDVLFLGFGCLLWLLGKCGSCMCLAENSSGILPDMAPGSSRYNVFLGVQSWPSGMGWGGPQEVAKWGVLPGSALSPGKGGRKWGETEIGDLLQSWGWDQAMDWRRGGGGDYWSSLTRFSGRLGWCVPRERLLELGLG